MRASSSTTTIRSTRALGDGVVMSDAPGTCNKQGLCGSQKAKNGQPDQELQILRLVRGAGQGPAIGALRHKTCARNPAKWLPCNPIRERAALKSARRRGVRASAPRL